MVKQHNKNLDILRGVAAFLVVFYHLVLFHDLFDKGLALGPVFNYDFPGHLAVLIFFVLSGYVIGLNHPTITSRKEVGVYIKKRLVRVVPIYFVVVLCTAFFVAREYNLTKVLSNLFFVSVPMNNVMTQDSPLWSLNYELLYYFIFIFIAWFKIDLKKTLVALLIIITAAFAFFHERGIYPLFISYFIGLIFWITGAMIAQTKLPEWKISNSRMVSVFLMVFCIDLLNPYVHFLQILKINVHNYDYLNFFQRSITYADLFYLPFTFILICSLTYSANRFNKIFLYSTYACTLFSLYMIFHYLGWDYMVKEHFVVPAVFLISSIFLWVSNFSFNIKINQVLKSSASLSTVSYAVYILHMPLLFTFGWITATSPLLFTIKFVAYLTVLYTVSWLLEEKYQIYIKSLFFKKRAQTIPVSDGAEA